MEAVFCYNISPKTGQEDSVPRRAVLKYEATPMTISNEEQASVQKDKEIWVQPPDSQYATQ